MNGVIIGIDPAAHLGPFMLRWYGLFFTLAIVTGLALREAAQH